MTSVGERPGHPPSSSPPCYRSPVTSPKVLDCPGTHDSRSPSKGRRARSRGSPARGGRTTIEGGGRMRMMFRLLVLGCVLAIPLSATAQNKFAGKCSQGKPDPNYIMKVDDRANHALVLGQVTCTWSSGDIAGVALKSEVDTVFSDMTGTTSRDRGYGVGTAENGDKYFVRFDGTTTYKGEAPTTGTCNWTFSGGTGKFKGLKGKGTCTGTFDAAGGAAFDV